MQGLELQGMEDVEAETHSLDSSVEDIGLDTRTMVDMSERLHQFLMHEFHHCDNKITWEAIMEEFLKANEV